MAGEPTETDDAVAGTDLVAQNAALQARVDALEIEVAELRRTTATTLASAQETLYWFERWGVDFNSLFARREMEVLRKAFRGLRQVYRRALNTKRRFLS